MAPPETMQVTPQAAFERAQTFYNAGNVQGAAKLLSEVASQAPNHAASLHLLGIILYQNGQPEEAIKLLHRAVQHDPNAGLYLTNFTEILRSENHLDDALVIGLRAVQAAPGSASALSNLGLVFYDQEDLPKAKRAQQNALKIDPNFRNALNNLGSIARDEKDLKTASDFYKKAMKAQPENPESGNNLATIQIEDERFDDALNLLLTLVKDHPKHSEIYRNIGRAYLMISENDKAEFAFKQSMALNPDKAETYLGLSQVMVEKNQQQLAIDQALKALSLDPEKTSILHQVGVCVADLGDPKKALDYYEQALTIDPEFIPSILARGQLKMENGDLIGAQADFDFASQTDPESIAPVLSQCRIGKISKGSEIYKRMSDLLPQADDMPAKKQVSFRFSMGKCFEDTKDFDKAFAEFAKGCSLKRADLKYDADQYDAKITRICQVFDKPFIESLKKSAHPSATPIFVLGMPRSGTTLTESIIASHSQVFGAGELSHLQREFDFGDLQSPLRFPNHLAQKSIVARKNAADAYITALTKYDPNAPRITDKMPANFLYVGLIHAIFPNAKIIHTARNPMDTCLSCFTRLFERSQFHSYDLMELARYYTNYRVIMDHWKSVLPETAFHTIRYEDLVDDIETGAKGLIDHCGLDWEDTCLEFHKSKRRVRTASVTQVRQPIYKSSMAKWKRYETQMEPLRQAIGHYADHW